MQEIPRRLLSTKLICTWKPYVQEQSCCDETLGKLKAGDIIIIVGEVLETSTTLEKKCENKSSIVRYNVLETRKLT